MVSKKALFLKICRDIKSVKIQGATNIAKAALRAYYLFPTEKSKKILRSLRPTEPLLSHVIELAGKVPKQQILNHFKQSQDLINKEVFKLIKKDNVIFTHCHSTSVIKALIYAKKHGKRFEVYNTETRPLFQGRKTAKELSKAGIKITQFVDSAISIALKKEQGTKKVNLILLGADALLDKTIINKVGSRTIARLAKDYKIPVYIIADSWKRAHKNLILEQRYFKEVWNPKKNRLHIKNPAFEAIPKDLITAIITEQGKMKYSDFIKKIH